MRIIIRLIRLIMLIRLMSALSFPILQRETASRSLSPTAGRSKEQLLWKNICRRKTDLFSYQIGFQFVGLVKTISLCRKGNIDIDMQGHTIGKTLQSAAATNLDDYTSSAMPQH